MTRCVFAAPSNKFKNNNFILADQTNYVACLWMWTRSLRGTLWRVQHAYNLVAYEICKWKLTNCLCSHVYPRVKGEVVHLHMCFKRTQYGRTRRRHYYIMHSSAMCVNVANIHHKHLLHCACLVQICRIVRVQSRKLRLCLVIVEGNGGQTHDTT